MRFFTAQNDAAEFGRFRDVARLWYRGSWDCVSGGQTGDLNRRHTLDNFARQKGCALLALGILATNTGGYALAAWIKDAFRTLLTETRGPEAAKGALWWIGVYYVCFRHYETAIAK